MWYPIRSIFNTTFFSSVTNPKRWSDTDERLICKVSHRWLECSLGCSHPWQTTWLRMEQPRSANFHKSLVYQIVSYPSQTHTYSLYIHPLCGWKLKSIVHSKIKMYYSVIIYLDSCHSKPVSENLHSSLEHYIYNENGCGPGANMLQTGQKAYHTNQYLNYSDAMW